MTSDWIAAGVAIAVWGVMFASTRVLLEEFSALEINIARFGLAWVALLLLCAAKGRRARRARPTISGWSREVPFYTFCSAMAKTPNAAQMGS